MNKAAPGPGGQDEPRRSPLRPAVFLDRDGTLVEDVGLLRRPDQLRFLPGAVSALRRLQERFLLFLVTHQPFVSRGELCAAEVQEVHRVLEDRLRREGVRLTDVFLCPHTREEGCVCIKPNPYFLEKAAAQHGLDLERSWSVGDHPHDAALAPRAGGRGLYVLTGHGRRHRAQCPPGQACVPGLREAASWILAAHERAGRGRPTEEDLDRAAQILRTGGVLVMPTETVYGLAADAGNVRAVARVFAIKHRPRFDPLIVHLAAPDQLRDVVRSVPAPARELVESFWPGPLTLVLPKADRVPDLVTAGLPSVAVRMPCHPVALELLRRVGRPLAAPSANRFGRVSPTNLAAARAELGARADAYLDGGDCGIGIESTVVSLLEERPRLLRPGGLPVEELETVAGAVSLGPPPAGSPAGPGMLARHYAPGTRVSLWAAHDAPPDAGSCALLTPLPLDGPSPFAHTAVLSERGDPWEAAARLFAELRRIDALGVPRLYVRPGPEEGLWRAINDRLRRAAGRPAP